MNRLHKLSPEQTHCEQRESLIARHLSLIIQDLRFSVRMLRKHPLSNVVIVFTIALLIAGISVIYGTFLGELMRRVPFPEPDRFVKFWRVDEESIGDSFPGDLYARYSASLTSLEGIGALDGSEPKTLTGVGEARSYEAQTVSVNLLELAGIPPLRGRLFVEADPEAEGDRPIIISEQMWRAKLEADENVIGRRLRLNDELHLVVGVLPASMRNTRLAHNYNTDIWLPRRFEPDTSGFRLFGRLKSDVTLEQARAEMQTLAKVLEQERTPDEEILRNEGHRTATLAPIGENLRNRMDRASVEMLLAILFATVILGCVVGIACFNVTNLLLARGTARGREMAVRLAMGAGRLRILRLTLMESVLLASLGGVAGLLASAWLIQLIRAKTFLSARFDPQLFLLAAGGALLLGALVGLLPAVRSARTDLTDALKDGGQSTGGRKRHRLRNFLVASEIAMTVVLFVAAALSIRAYLHLQEGDLGFDPDKAFIMRVNFRDGRYAEARDRLNYLERAKQALEEIPGVSSVAVAASVGLMNMRISDEVRIEATGNSEAIQTKSGVDYGSRELPVLKGMSLVRGRGLSTDAASAANEVLVNESFVNEHLVGREPIGLQIRVGREDSSEQPPKWRTIVGVVRDQHPLVSGSQGRSEAILDYRDAEGWWSQHVDALYAQTTGNAKVMRRPIREALQRLDALQPVEQPLFMADLMEERTSFRKTAIKLLGGLGGVGLLMALMGVYGVVAFSVHERTREVGIRMAVGATRANVLKLMLWQGARLMVLGVVPGLLIGTSASAALPGDAFGDRLSAFDPITCLIVMVVVGAGGFLASFFPARNAAELNPMEALRYE